MLQVVALKKLRKSSEKLIKAPLADTMKYSMKYPNSKSSVSAVLVTIVRIAMEWIAVAILVQLHGTEIAANVFIITIL